MGSAAGRDGDGRRAVIGLAFVVAAILIVVWRSLASETDAGESTMLSAGSLSTATVVASVASASSVRASTSPLLPTATAVTTVFQATATSRPRFSAADTPSPASFGENFPIWPTATATHVPQTNMRGDDYPEITGRYGLGTGNGDVWDCADFSTIEEASMQTLRGDRHRLDTDGDGVACEGMLPTSLDLRLTPTATMDPERPVVFDPTYTPPTNPEPLVLPTRIPTRTAVPTREATATRALLSPREPTATRDPFGYLDDDEPTEEPFPYLPGDDPTPDSFPGIFDDDPVDCPVWDLTCP